MKKKINKLMKQGEDLHKRAMDILYEHKGYRHEINSARYEIERLLHESLELADEAEEKGDYKAAAKALRAAHFLFGKRDIVALYSWEAQAAEFLSLAALEEPLSMAYDGLIDIAILRGRGDALASRPFAHEFAPDFAELLQEHAKAAEIVFITRLAAELRNNQDVYELIEKLGWPK